MTLLLEGLVEGRPSRFVLDDGRYRIGRVPFNDIHLSLSEISREHAELIVVGTRAELRDLGSRNGTFLDGERVYDKVEARAGQVVRFSGIEFTLVDGPVRDWKSCLQDAALSSPETVRSRPFLPVLEMMPGIGMAGSASACDCAESWPAGETAKALLSAMVRAGRQCVVPHSPADLAQEVCELVHGIIPSQRTAVLLGVFPARNPQLLAMHPAGTDQAAELLLSENEWSNLASERRPLVLERVRAKMRANARPKALTRALAIPLLDRGRCHGALYIERASTAPKYTVPEVCALIHFSDLLSLQLTDARLVQEHRRTARLRQELSIAAHIQSRMLHRSRGVLRGYEALARQIPCFEVGGDLYDISVLEDGRMVLVLGDVVGKGMGAALLMSNVLAALRVLYPELSDPGEIVTRIHVEMIQASVPSTFVTLFLGFLDPIRNQLHYVNAGHCSPIVMGPEGDRRFVKPDGLPVGILPAASYRTHTLDLAPDSIVCLFSDGIPEAENQGNPYGEERLAGALKSGFGLELEEAVEAIISDLRRFVGEEPLQDDATILLLRRRDKAA